MAIMSHGFGSILSFTPSLTTKITIVRHPCRQNPKLPLMVFSTVNRASNKDLIWLFGSSSLSSSSFNRVQCALYPNTSNALLQDVEATALVMAGAYGLVRVFDDLTERRVIQQSLSRKLVHVLSGLLFLFCWPIFSNSSEARYFAAIVPFVNCLRLVINGLSLANDEGLVKSVTREGNPKELLRGPLFYVLILILSAVIFWRESPVGVMSLALMCGGDGFADIIGRRFGTLKIPYNQQKSLAGSLAMLTFGFSISIGMLYYFSALGYFELDWSSTVGRVALVSLVATLVESLPTTENSGCVHNGEQFNKSLNLSQRLNIAIDVASALEYLHHDCEIPIAHCDLNPSNLHLDDAMTAHVSDFGLARFLERMTDNSFTNLSFGLKGTITYIPPEYGMGGQVSIHGDIYSYGILLLEMVTRRRPTDGMFKDDLCLHNFAALGLPDRVMEIVDPLLFRAVS